MFSPTVWEKGGEEAKNVGHSGVLAPPTPHLSSDKCCKISVDTLKQPPYTCADLPSLAAPAVCWILLGCQ